MGPELLVGLSTHAPAEIDAVDPALVDYIGVGPVHETPTKPGRPAVGAELVRYAAAHAPVPFFAIGGLDAATSREVIDAGARRACVLRAIADAEDPRRRRASCATLLDAAQRRGGGRAADAAGERAATSRRARRSSPLGADERPPALLVAVARVRACSRSA